MRGSRSRMSFDFVPVDETALPAIGRRLEHPSGVTRLAAVEALAAVSLGLSGRLRLTRETSCVR